MPAPASSRPRLRRRAAFALWSFVAATLVALLAPIAQGHGYLEVCSAQGTKRVAIDGHVDAGHGSSSVDHTAHCPLCMPVGAPPSDLAWDFTPVQPLSFVRESIPAARLASLVGAPLPARGPPLPT